MANPPDPGCGCSLQAGSMIQGCSPGLAARCRQGLRSQVRPDLDGKNARCGTGIIGGCSMQAGSTIPGADAGMLFGSSRLYDPRCRGPEPGGFSIPRNGMSLIWMGECSMRKLPTPMTTARRIRTSLFSTFSIQGADLPDLRDKAVGQGMSSSSAFFSTMLYHIFFNFAEEITKVPLLNYVYNSPRNSPPFSGGAATSGA